MSQSSDHLGEKARPAGEWRAARGEEAQRTPGSKARRKIPESYLAKHPCKVCNGKSCVGNCRF